MQEKNFLVGLEVKVLVDRTETCSVITDEVAQMQHLSELCELGLCDFKLKKKTPPQLPLGLHVPHLLTSALRTF